MTSNLERCIGFSNTISRIKDDLSDIINDNQTILPQSRKYLLNIRLMLTWFQQDLQHHIEHIVEMEVGEDANNIIPLQER